MLLVLVISAGAQTRRALVVGIDKYQTATASVPPSGTRIPLKGTATRTKWVNLDGAVNDAQQMKALLIGRFGFPEENVRFLDNEKATADANLGAIQTHLIDAGKPGDISFFYYAGHGSQIRNSIPFT